MIYVLSGGGSGGTLVVTSSGAGTVTVSNSTLGKSYSKTVTAGGSVTFKGLKTGTWTVKLSNGTQTATKTVTINADYSTSIAYFAATISITYPATSTCVVKNSSGTTVASDTNTGSSTKTWTATVNAKGTYTVTATATDGSGKTKSTTVNITADGQSVSVTLSYATYYFKNGDISALTGGWTNATVGTTLNAKINVRSDGYGQTTTVTSNNTINLTNIKTIHVIGTMKASGEFSAAEFSVETASTSVKGAINTANSKKDFTLDVSSISSGKFKFNLNSGRDYASISISEIYGD